jgi:hypothetical protein
MSAAAMELQQSTIREYTRQLHLPTLGSQFLKLAEEAVKQKLGHVAYLEALLSAELEERERNAENHRSQVSEGENPGGFSLRGSATGTGGADSQAG